MEEMDEKRSPEERVCGSEGTDGADSERIREREGGRVARKVGNETRQT